MNSKIYEEIFKNTKTKIYPDGSVNTVYCDHAIFTDPSAVEKYSDELKVRDEQIDDFFELTSDYTEDELEHRKQEREVLHTKLNVDAPARDRSDSFKRSKDKVYDIIRLNEWKYFLTITFDGSEYDFKNPEFVKTKVNKWLKNQVHRSGLKYILIPERHKNGGIHCHALINDALEVVDSGTRIVAGYGKPVTLDTVSKYRLDVLHTVYNVPKWKYGFSTAIEVSNTGALAHYVTKYITKDNDKIFGKYYWAGGDINREPQIVYSNTSFNSVNRPLHQKPYTSFAYKYASNFEVSNLEEIAERFGGDVNAMLEFLYSAEFRNEVD